MTNADSKKELIKSSFKDSFNEDIENRIRAADLLDLYGKLLTQKQQDVMSHYYCDNFSLTEIAENLNISRQGVYDAIKKSMTLLNGYEEKLRFMERSGKK